MYIKSKCPGGGGGNLQFSKSFDIIANKRVILRMNSKLEFNINIVISNKNHHKEQLVKKNSI